MVRLVPFNWVFFSQVQVLFTVRSQVESSVKRAVEDFVHTTNCIHTAKLICNIGNLTSGGKGLSVLSCTSPPRWDERRGLSLWNCWHGKQRWLSAEGGDSKVPAVCAGAERADDGCEHHPLPQGHRGVRQGPGEWPWHQGWAWKSLLQLAQSSSEALQHCNSGSCAQTDCSGLQGTGVVTRLCQTLVWLESSHREPDLVLKHQNCWAA